MGEHGLAEIGADHVNVMTLSQDLFGHVAASGCDIEQHLGIPRFDPSDEFPAPEDVRAHAQDVIGKNIAVSDVREGAFYKSRILHGERRWEEMTLANDPAFTRSYESLQLLDERIILESLIDGLKRLLNVELLAIEQLVGLS